MKPAHYFLIQFVWFLIAWSVIARLFIEPRLRDLEPRNALAVLVAPHLFRVLGVGLLVPNLAPGLPWKFAVSTAIGDSLTALLALSALIALHGRWRLAQAAVWLFNLAGSLDLSVAMIHAARIKAADYLLAQWYVPALVVPLMIVTHVMIFRTLLRNRTNSNNRNSP